MFNDQKQLGTALATAFLIALPAMMATRLVEYDEAIFLDVARNIQQTGLPIRSIGQKGIFFFDHTPLYVYLLSLAPVSSTTGVPFARLATMACGLGSIWLVFLIGKRIAGTQSGFAAALLLALNPFFALYSFFVRMEVPMVFWSLLGLLLIMTNEGDQRPMRLALAGLALAVAVLLKEVALLIVGYSVVYMLLVGNHNRRWLWKEAVLIGTPTVVALAGWAIWCWQLSPSTFASTMSRWLNSTATGRMLDPRGLISASQWAGQIALSLLGPALTICILAIAAWSVVTRSKPRFPQQVFLWGYLMLAISFSFVVRLKELRHIITIVPVAALLVSTTIDWHQIEVNWRQGSWRRRAAYGLVLVLVLCAPLHCEFRHASWET
jgi:4-amino-4-deoxy-L-arabinose transferase-like glycosyltransferase